INMGVHRVSALCEVGIHVLIKVAAFAAVDGGCVRAGPFAYGLQNRNRLLRYGAIGLGTDISEIVTATVRASDQVIDDGLGSFPVVVGLVISPTVIQGHAGFPGASPRRSLDMLLGCGEISGQAIAIIDDDVWLEFEYHLVHLF